MKYRIEMRVFCYPEEFAHPTVFYDEIERPDFDGAWGAGSEMIRRLMYKLNPELKPDEG